MTVTELRRILRWVGHVLAQAGPIILAIADAIARRPTKPKPPQ